MARSLYIEKAFGKLREICIFPPNTLPVFQNDQKSLVGELETIRVWSDYGQYNENRITLISNGKNENICLNGFEISNSIKDTHYFQVSRDDADTHRFIIEGRDNKGRLFENEFFVQGRDVLPSIVYSILLITHLPNIELTNQYWKSINNNYWYKSNLSLEEKLKLLIQVKKFAKEILKEYPFMEMFFQKGITNMIEVCKFDLNEYNVLNK